MKRILMLTPLADHVLSRIRRCSLVFAVAVGMSVMAGSAYCRDISLSPDVQALVGMKISPVVKGGVSVASGSIPGFLVLGSSAAVTGSGSDAIIEGRYIWFQTGVASGRPMLFVMGGHKDLTTKIFDVLMLPPDLIDWYFEGDFEYEFQHHKADTDRHFKWRTGRFTLSESCRSNKNDERLILGLIKQEKGKETCSHYSKRVKQAWLIDKQSGRLTPISTRGLQCHYISMDDCY